MTLGEWLHELERPTLLQVCLVTLYHIQSTGATDGATTGDVRQSLKLAGKNKLAKSNIADVLVKASPYVHIVGREGRTNRYALTQTGLAEAGQLVPSQYKQSSTVHDARGLQELAQGLGPAAAAYVQEAVLCLQAGALRASVVFLWSGAVRTIQEKLIEVKKRDIDEAVVKRHTRAIKIRNIDQFAYLKESTLIQVAEDVGLYDRNQRAVLVDHCLDLRNKCGHPGAYRPGVQKVRSFIEDVVATVF